MRQMGIAKFAIASTVIIAAALLGASASAEARQRDWLMVVKSVNTDPNREDAFNRWYNDIDIPDVLQVPGYMRARRGERVTHDADRGQTDAGDAYLALYDIRSPDIDKTIIAMLMASWRMDQLGRSTELIKVVERIYYRRLASPVTGAGTDGQRWLFLIRTDRSPGSAKLRQLASTGRFQRATRYVLDRVLMHEPHSVPEYLTVFEIAANSSERAAMAAEAIRSALPCRDQGLYRVTKDEARP